MISSTTNTNMYSFFIYTLFLCFCFQCCSSKDNITTGDSIDDAAEYLESADKNFQMGFFSHPTGSKKRYVGIWYAMDPKTVVWVANRDQAVMDSSGFLTITDHGNVMVMDKYQNVYFNTTTGGAYQKALKLLDSGNAVLIDISTGAKRWQSFDNPTDTFLPGMKMDTNLKLTSWKSVDDPSTGSFTFQQEETPQYVISKANSLKPHWKSGSGSMKNFDPNPLFIEAYYLLTNSTTNTNDYFEPFRNGCRLNSTIGRKPSNHTNTSCFNNSLVVKTFTRILMSYTGNIQYFSWVGHDKQWLLDWQEPKDNCSINEVCGKFGLCNVSKQYACSCLPGFDPIQVEDHSAGCLQKSANCSIHNDFMNISMVKVDNPPTHFDVSNESYCKNQCLQSCDCNAYSYTPASEELKRRGLPGNRCWIWETLTNLQTEGKSNIFIRVKGYHNQEKGSRFITETHILIFVMTILVILLLCSLSYTYYRRLVTREQGRNSVLQTNNNERWALDLLDLDHSREEDTEGIGIPFFHFESILDATDRFSDSNKLGQGGFGTVYKGMLPGGLEVAVKRLSSLSNQGLEEFRNEVTLIAKLQHRNLVRLVGYCMKGNEKMLLYEYMPNKSLDMFIFDRAPTISLDWAKRYDIILGIARGLLYLHQDSRLRIIHRDLKTSNILLDAELNPRISDFGLAKIVQDREMEASTNRVIGTYGYMAPEYALDGFFSIKSDVFSFGVVVLEIISGKKNTVSPQIQQKLSLLGYAWNLWKEDMPFELMDKRILESSNSSEVLKCIIVGLLCVQEDPGDRPTMTNVVLMLASDISSLPVPKQPAFVARKTMSSSSSSSYKPDQTQTSNTITVTLQEGR